MTADGGAGIRPQAGRATVMPGSRPYVQLAEAGYPASAAFSLANVVLLATLHEAGFAFGWAETFVSAAITLLLSVAWIQLGRSQGVSWFLAVGVFGGASAVLSLIIPLETLPILTVASIALSLAEAIVSPVYFAAQLLAFYTAAKSFQVRLFAYAVYLLAIGFVASPIAGAALVASASNFQPVVGETVSYLAYGGGLVISAWTALVAAVGFHRLRGAQRLDPRLPQARGSR